MENNAEYFALESPSGERGRIPTNLRALLILEILGNSDRPLTATEINEVLGLPKPTIHRLCKTLEQNGFIARHGNSQKFHPARRLRALGSGLLRGSHLHIARRQILIDVASQVKETVNFLMPAPSGMRYVDRVETDWPFKIQMPIGTVVPFHCTAGGKCFLASLAPRARQSLVASLKLDKMTPTTWTDADALLDDLSVIAERGYSLDNEEFLEGMVAIAVPVTDTTGQFMAALAFHGPTQRLTVDEAIARKELLIDAANKLRTALFSDD